MKTNKKKRKKAILLKIIITFITALHKTSLSVNIDAHTSNHTIVSCVKSFILFFSLSRFVLRSFHCYVFNIDISHHCFSVCCCCFLLLSFFCSNKLCFGWNINIFVVSVGLQSYHMFSFYVVHVF